MQVQKINNSQLFVKNRSNNNLCDRKSLHNVSFGANRGNLINRLIGFPNINHVREFYSQGNFPKPNIFIGSSLYDVNGNYTLGCINVLKESGVKTIIDLDDSQDLKKLIDKQDGLKYYSYPVQDYFDNIISEKLPENSIKKRKEKLVAFLKEIQKDNVYINTSRSDYMDSIAIICNMFRPIIRNICVSVHDGQNLEGAYYFLKRIYPFFTDEDKKSFDSWTPDFDKWLKERLKLIK